MSGCIHDPAGDLLGNCYQCYPERRPRKPKWYQVAGTTRKWHLVDSKCIPAERQPHQYTWEKDDRFQRRVDLYEAQRAKEQESIIEATDTPVWSSVPLPSRFITKMCKRCIRVAGGRKAR